GEGQRERERRLKRLTPAEAVDRPGLVGVDVVDDEQIGVVRDGQRVLTRRELAEHRRRAVDESPERFVDDPLSEVTTIEQTAQGLGDLLVGARLCDVTI